MKLGIFGGTFDPIHLGHLLIAEMVRETLKLERLLFVPARDPPHKQTVAKTAADHRRAMVEMAIENNPYFELCPIDLERPGPHYSVDTVHLVRHRYAVSAEDCLFVMGSDSLQDLPTWYKPDKLIKLCRLAVVHRAGYQPNVDDLEQRIPGLSARLDWVPMAHSSDLASAAIRQSVRAGQSIRDQVPDRVRVYIQQHQLYLVPGS
jgi:nicotinate-nucleotide adenylyltransferase